jgi:hypothetical protein
LHPIIAPPPTSSSYQYTSNPYLESHLHVRRIPSLLDPFIIFYFASGLKQHSQDPLGRWHTSGITLDGIVDTSKKQSLPKDLFIKEWVMDIREWWLSHS